MVTWDNKSKVCGKLLKQILQAFFFQIMDRPATNGVDNVWVALVDGDKRVGCGGARVGEGNVVMIKVSCIQILSHGSRLDGKASVGDGVKFVSLIPE